MTRGPVVDIGVPVHRRSQFVGRALQSILAQSHDAWRVTVSEDGEPTASVRAAVAPFLDDPRVELIATGDHLGLARHKTLLAGRGHGPYLALLDDDDVWDPQWLSRRVEFMEAHPRCGLVWGGHRDIDADDRELRRSPAPMRAGEHSSESFIAMMIRRNEIATPSVLVRRTAYVEAGGALDARFRHINDWELWLRLGMIAPVGYLAVHDSGYRVHAAQMSRRRDQAADDLLLVGHLDALLTRHLPQLRLSTRERRRLTAATTLSVALDQGEAGDRHGALRELIRAGVRDPTVLASSRALAALATVLAPRAGVRAIARRRP